MEMRNEPDNVDLRRENDLLREENQQLHRQIDELTRDKRELEEQLGAAQAQVARSAAPFRRPERAKVPPDQRRRSGRPAGHPGSHRPVPPVIDATEEVPLARCPRCGGGDLTDIQRVEQIIEEIPPVRPRTTKVITYSGTCRRCGRIASHHPLQTSEAQGAAKVQLGPRALATAVELNKVHGLTMRKTCRVLESLAGLRWTPGGLAQALVRVAGKVQGEYDRLIDRLRTSAAVFADETSWWVGGPGWWLWVFTTPTTTLYRVDHTRGAAVVEAVLGPEFAGMLVSDCLSSYDPAAYAKHKCIAHHLRAIHAARDLLGMASSSYLEEWTLFFKAVIVLYNLRVMLGEAEFTEKRRRIEVWRDALLDRPVGQSGEVRIRHRLEKQRAHLLGCLHEPQAEPTNNRAERALRPAVIGRKVSCGNKTERGKSAWEILTSLGVTCYQQGIDFITHLVDALRFPASPTAPSG